MSVASGAGGSGGGGTGTGTGTGKNRVVSKNSIAEHLWGDDSDQMDSHDFIYVHLRNLRKKLMDKGCNDYVQTIYGIGYNFKID